MKSSALLPDDPYLELFSYMRDEECNRVLLDIDDHASNLLRSISRNECDPVVLRSVGSFEEFRAAYIEPIEEPGAGQSLGLAFRGQISNKPLHSKLKRFWDNINEPLPQDGVPALPRREYEYKIKDINELVEKYLFQGGQYPLPSTNHLYAILQHYGAPTPLLDWTLSLDVALFFAFEFAPQKDHDHVVIYLADIGKFHVLNWRMWHRSIIPNPNISDLRKRKMDPRDLQESWLFLRPAAFGDIRFSVQQGIFAQQRFDSHRAMIPMEEFLENPMPYEIGVLPQSFHTSLRIPGSLMKVKLPVSERPSVMSYLEKRGITREQLFISWEHMCSELISRCTNRLLVET